MSWRSKAVAGFEGRDQLARVLAREIGARYVQLSIRHYRAGEIVVRAARSVSKCCLLVADLDASGEWVWQTLLAADALRSAGAKKVVLFAPWMAYGRQDRAAAARESAGGAVQGTTLSRAFNKVLTLDAHSKLYRKHFRGRLKSLSTRDLAVPIAYARHSTAIAAPDKGAEKRAKAVAKKMRLPFIQCLKVRARPGMGDVRAKVASGSPHGHRILLVDDMVDSGGTLLEAARALRAAGASQVGAVVTHAAQPASVPRAKQLGLFSMDILYRRNQRPLQLLVKVLAGLVR